MLKSLRSRLALLNRPPSSPASEREQLRDAVAALLFVLLLSDDQVQDSELKVIRAVLTGHFSVPAAEIDSYMDELGKRAADSTSQHRELKLIRDHCDLSERVRILQLCWQVAYADGHLSPDEEHLIRRIADILHIPHSHYIRAKMAQGAPSESQFRET